MVDPAEVGGAVQGDAVRERARELVNLMLVKDLRRHFLTTKLQTKVAAHIVYWDSELGCAVLAAHGLWGEKYELYANEAFDSLPPDLRMRILGKFAVKRI